jgi:endonuclease YncB( thermonuclease family)
MIRARRRDGPGPGAFAAMGLLALLLIHGCDPSPPHPAGVTADPTGPATRIPATVTHVADGDSFYVRLPSGDEEEIRIIGVDTPETVDPDEPVQCFGPEASAFTHGTLTPGTRVELEPGVERRDVYGRLLAYVYLHGRLFNAELARRGLARPLTIAPNDAKAPLFERLAARAAKRGRGLWGACPA